MLKRLGVFRSQVRRRFSDSFANAANANYIDQMYGAWKEDRTKVHASWDAYFSNLEAGVSSNEAVQGVPAPGSAVQIGAAARPEDTIARKMMEYVHEVRALGHYKSQIDPLNLSAGTIKRSREMNINDLDTIGISKEMMNRPFKYSSNEKGFLEVKSTWTPQELVDFMESVYCGKIGYEYGNIPDREVRDWIRSKIEKSPAFQYSKEEKIELLERILESQASSLFCEKKFPNVKRFGIEGLDASISGLKMMVRQAATMGVKQITLGMAHRGRLNVYTSVLEQPYDALLAMFENVKLTVGVDDGEGFSNDVKYHIGASNRLEFPNGKSIILNLLPNPSHLEAVNPLVLGHTRAIQDRHADETREISVPVVIHGDAALAGQGIIYELQQMELLDAYKVGGTVHVVFNNQIGFTTNPNDGRTAYYCSNIAKMNNNFVIHVNAHEPELVDFAFKLALEYRMKFKRDVFLDIVGYRVFGHNETDQPRFTQPEYYEKVKNKTPMYLEYAQRLAKEGVISETYAQERLAHYEALFTESLKKVKVAKEVSAKDLELFDWNQQLPKDKGTSAITEADFKELGALLVKYPPETKIHNTIANIYKERQGFVETGTGIDFAFAEALAFASLMKDGHSVRMTGEDCERGTFSHRQAIIVDQETNKKFLPMNNVVAHVNAHRHKKVNFMLKNSLLSEYAVLGFEVGHSWAFPNDLTLWEAQFGDFVNTAQVIVDQFVMTAEAKWRKRSSLVMLLPHGYDGQGPEHSNTRLERFLTHINDNYVDLATNKEARKHLDRTCNAKIINCTFSANYFHALRDQIKRPYRKPLIVIAPKKLLRDKKSRSNIEEFTGNSKFVPLLEDKTITDKSKVTKILFCSGQIYFDLIAQRAADKKEHEVAIFSLEQVAPFPYNEFEKALHGYNKSTQVVWVSEEPLNFGAFPYVENRANLILKEQGFHNIGFAGRPIAAVPAPGSMSLFTSQTKQLIADALKEVSK